LNISLPGLEEDNQIPTSTKEFSSKSLLQFLEEDNQIPTSTSKFSSKLFASIS
jgi:hypothetical protein